MKRKEKQCRKRAEHQLEGARYELGRYKKKVTDQQKELDKLREEISGYQQSVDLSYALVTAAVLHAGELTITREELRDIIRERRLAVVSCDETAYTLRMEEVGEDGTG